MNDGITTEVISGVLIACVCWIGGLLINWFNSRSKEVAMLRKYERLRAKVEVISQLAAIPLSSADNQSLADRHEHLIARELEELLQELEGEAKKKKPGVARVIEEEEEDPTPDEFEFSSLWKPFILPPSYGFWPWMTKFAFYGSVFLLLAVAIILVLTMFTITESRLDTKGVHVEGMSAIKAFSATLVISLPFLGFSLFSWMIARAVHRKNTPRAVPPPIPVTRVPRAGN